MYAIKICPTGNDFKNNAVYTNMLKYSKPKKGKSSDIIA